MTNKELLTLARTLMEKANDKLTMSVRVRKAAKAKQTPEGHRQAMIYRADELKAQAKALREQSLTYQRQLTREGASR